MTMTLTGIKLNGIFGCRNCTSFADGQKTLYKLEIHSSDSNMV